MALSSKRKRELNRLRGNAGDLWDDQKDVIERANRIIREASRQAGNYAREDVVPRVRDTFDNRVRPAVASGVGTAVAVLEVAKDPHVREALKRISAKGSKVASRTGIVKAKPSPGPGRYVLVGIGIVALAGVAYAAWQTLRADDDLWIDDEENAEQTGNVQPS